MTERRPTWLDRVLDVLPALVIVGVIGWLIFLARHL